MTQPHVLLLTATRCPHCQSMKLLLQDRLERGLIAGLEIINLQEQPEVAQQYNVRSVPWLKLGDFVFDTTLTPGELDIWIEVASHPGGQGQYLSGLLEGGRLNDAIQWIVAGKATLKDLVSLISDPDTKLTVRIGISAVMEHFEGDERISSIIDELAGLTRHVLASVRIDAGHYLSLTHNERARPTLMTMLDDTDVQVRQAAAEALDEL